MHGQAMYKCAPREGRELSVYSVTRWVRRVRKAEDDGDWRFEMTARRVIGAAFFNRKHRGGRAHRDQTDGSHGRGNSSARARWELHPVYWVRQL
jgi:hypothetical protein